MSKPASGTTKLAVTPHLMDPSPTAEGAALPNTAVGAQPDADYGLNIVMVYEDALNEQWANEVRERVAQVVGPQAARCQAWQISELEKPEVLKQAVLNAVEADVILVSMQAAERLPRHFSLWIDGWLGHRLQVSGALVALLGQLESAGPEAGQTREQLYAAARKAGMDFLVEERTRRPAMFPASSAIRIGAPAAPVQLLHPALETGSSAPDLRHWGINE